MNGGDSMANEEIVSLGRPLPRIASVDPLDGRRVRIAWSSGIRAGQSEAIDLGPVIANHRHFVPLRGNDALFRSVRPVDDGTGIEWDEGIAISAARIEAIPNRSITNDEFRHVMDDLDMTLDGMAATLGIARRSVADYRKTKPIPPLVALAVRGLVLSMASRSSG